MSLVELLEKRQLMSTVYLEVGSNQTYHTVQAAINAVPTNSSNSYDIQIAAGTYNEADVVAQHQNNITLQGLGSNRSTIIQSNGNGSPAIWVKGTGFSATNITFYNAATTAQHDEAVYLDTNATHADFSNVTIKGQQDTFYCSTGVVADVHNSDVWGSVDFIWGYGTIFFSSDNLYMTKSGGTVCAPATPQGQTYGFVFSNCNITTAPGYSLSAGSTYLGRPWGLYGQATFIDCTCSSIINSAGWLAWSGQNPDTSRMDQYGLNISTSKFVSWSHNLTSSQAASFSQSDVLGGWSPPI
jgi:pectinesterase